MALNIRALALAGALAGTTVLASPAAAAARPATEIGAVPAAFEGSRFDPVAATAEWRCRGFGCGWGYPRGHRRNRVDAGDVLIGAAIIGGVAAILSSNNRRTRERDVVLVERDRDFRDRDPDYRDDRRDDRSWDRRPVTRSTGASGLDNAADLCVDQIERDVRVETVDDVERTGAGWQVSGTLFNGSPFQCRIGNNGQIDGIDYGDGFAGASDASSGAYAPRADGQWTDRRYADARLAVNGGVGGIAQPQAQAPESYAAAPAQRVNTDRMPAYPGGPIPGEDIPETIDGEL